MDENKFKELMQQSKLEIQFTDFDDKVMEQIKLKEKSRKLVWKNLKLSWIFFIIGTFFGINVSRYLVNLYIPFLGEYSKLLILLIEILIVFVIVSQFDKLVNFTFKKRE
jgi:hypothetical protein